MEEGRLDNAVKFTGKDLDRDTGLYYYNARWYDQEIGRFISEDPAQDGLNWYTYAKGNPLVHVDPDGKIAIPIFLSGPPATPQSKAAREKAKNSVWQGAQKASEVGEEVREVEKKVVGGWLVANVLTYQKLQEVKGRIIKDIIIWAKGKNPSRPGAKNRKAKEEQQAKESKENHNQKEKESNQKPKSAHPGEQGRFEKEAEEEIDLEKNKTWQGRALDLLGNLLSGGQNAAENAEEIENTTK